jgi:RHS repeat-associated protein
VEKSNGTLYWYCAPCGRLLATTDLSGNIISEWTYFNGQRIARRDVSSGNVYYIFSDRLGSYRTLTNSTGTVQGESDYYPFGGERVISSTVTDSLRFAGMEWDSEDGLSHTLYRQYTPAQARWETPDPKPGCVNFPQSLNRYAYVSDDPTNLTDPSGDTAWLCWPNIAYCEDLFNACIEYFGNAFKACGASCDSTFPIPPSTNAGPRSACDKFCFSILGVGVVVCATAFTTCLLYTVLTCP